MAHKYKTVVNFNSLKGLKKVERLVKRGWRIAIVGLCTILLEKHS